jgi:predicted MPP superfamily phosphohydrolase
VVEGDCHLYVTSGLGTSVLPLRLGIPPEVVIVEVDGRRLAKTASGS